MHFYAKDNEGNIQPKHFVAMAKDPSRTRPSRVTDAKKAAKNGEVWMPSVTTVLGILDKPALVNWKVDKHLEQAYRLAKNGQSKILEDWKKEVKALTQEELDKAPQAGNDIHKVLEDCLFNNTSPIDDTEKLIVDSCEKAIYEAAKANPDNTSLEKYFLDETYGYAGCADVVVDGNEKWVIDYKSKQEASKFKPGKMAYPEHSRQLAAYGKAFFGEKEFRAANIFICLETGEIDFYEHEKEKLENGWLDFKDCLSIHQRNTYNPKEIK